MREKEEVTETEKRKGEMWEEKGSGKETGNYGAREIMFTCVCVCLFVYLFLLYVRTCVSV